VQSADNFARRSFLGVPGTYPDPFWRPFGESTRGARAGQLVGAFRPDPTRPAA